MIDNRACADDCTHPDHRHTEPPPPSGRPKSRTCSYSACANPVIRRAGEKKSHYRARQCCSPECGKAHQREVMEAAAEARWVILQGQHKPCVICKAKVIHRPSETVERYVSRATCGASDCVRELQRRKATGSRGEQAHSPSPPAPRIIGPELVLDFGAHNLAFRADPRRISKPFVTSYGVSGGWAVRG